MGLVLTKTNKAFAAAGWENGRVLQRKQEVTSALCTSSRAQCRHSPARKAEFCIIIWASSSSLFQIKTAVKRIQFHWHSCPFALLSAQLWESRFTFSLHSLIPRVHKSHSSCVLWQWDKHRRQRGLGAAVGVQLLLCQWGYNNISLRTNTRCKTKIPAACRCC